MGIRSTQSKEWKSYTILLKCIVDYAFYFLTFRLGRIFSSRLSQKQNHLTGREKNLLSSGRANKAGFDNNLWFHKVSEETDCWDRPHKLLLRGDYGTGGGKPGPTCSGY